MYDRGRCKEHMHTTSTHTYSADNQGTCMQRAKPTPAINSTACTQANGKHQGMQRHVGLPKTCFYNFAHWHRHTSHTTRHLCCKPSQTSLVLRDMPQGCGGTLPPRPSSLLLYLVEQQPIGHTHTLSLRSNTRTYTHHDTTRPL